MRSPSPLAIAAVLATACLFAGAASLGGRWSEEGAFWPPVLLLALGGVSALVALWALRPDVAVSLPATSALLLDHLERAGGHTATQLTAMRALCHGLYGEHDQARLAVEALPDAPSTPVVRSQTLAALSYLRGDGLIEALDHARRAQRTLRRERAGVQASTLGEFYVAWGEALTGELPETELDVLEAASQHGDLLVSFMARAALARTLSSFGHEGRARILREALHRSARDAQGLLAHADGGSDVSGVRTSVLPETRARVVGER